MTKPRKRKKKKVRSTPSPATPSQDQISLLLTYFQAGSLPEAEALATSLTQQFPKHPFGWQVLGVVFMQTGRVKESLAPMQSAVKLSLQDAEAHYNLGCTLTELGRLGEAEASYRQAIALRPDFAKAYNNLGNMLQKEGRLAEAESICRRAIAIKPDYAEAHNNLGVTLRYLGRLDDAILSYICAINLKADYSGAYVNLGAALRGVSFKKGDQSLYPILTNLITRENFVRPGDVATAILSLLRQDHLIENSLLKTAAIADIQEVDRATKILAQVPLLYQLMRICVLPELEFEAVFVSMRRVLLESLGKIDAPPETIDFLSTLSLHCFTNEYVYLETKEEAALVSVLETAISECLARESQPAIAEILCLATYRPLHQYDWSEKLQVLQQLPEVQTRLLEEPRTEMEIARDMPVLAGIEDKISVKVRDQYETNPYPRWVKLKVPLKAKSLAEVCDEAKLNLHSEVIRHQLFPSILIAGCGTGLHPIETASRFANCQVTAVDLSRASLAYAQRKTSELGITNIEYLQADILHLEELGRKFDIVESSGVLHHMDDPMAGWRVLVDLLKTGGLMKIGLYSELARRHIVMIREEIAALGIGTSGDEIRQFRYSIAESHHPHHRLLTRSHDFFSLSTLRDLIFHVQEHRFTAIRIQNCLDDLGLKFCGFEGQDIVARFEELCGKKVDICDLSLWHQFEESHPRTFASMYQFWCQKV